MPSIKPPGMLPRVSWWMSWDNSIRALMVSPPVKPPAIDHQSGAEKHNSNSDQQVPESSWGIPIAHHMQDPCLVRQASSSIPVLCSYENILWPGTWGGSSLWEHGRLFFSISVLWSTYFPLTSVPPSPVTNCTILPQLHAMEVFTKCL